MQNPDSFDRIVSYFHALARSPFTYRGRVIEPYASLRVSPLVFRSYTCPEGCGACCMKCSLVFDRPIGDLAIGLVDSRHDIQEFTLNGKSLPFVVDEQKDNTGQKCHYLEKRTGRCGIYHCRPLPCRLELFKFVHVVTRNQAQAMVRLPGRGHALTRVTGEKGNKCEIVAYDPDMTRTHVEDLDILRRWMNFFEIENDAADVMSYLAKGPSSAPLEIFR